MTGSFSGFRTGLLAVPMYLFFMGGGHIWLGQIMSSETTRPRDGPYIKSSRPDVMVMFLGTLFAWAVAHFLGRRRPHK